MPNLTQTMNAFDNTYTNKVEVYLDNENMLFSLTKGECEAVYELFEAGKKLTAIKLLRTLYGIGLAEAKFTCEIIHANDWLFRVYTKPTAYHPHRKV